MTITWGYKDGKYGCDCDPNPGPDTPMFLGGSLRKLRPDLTPAQREEAARIGRIEFASSDTKRSK